MDTPASIVFTLKQELKWKRNLLLEEVKDVASLVKSDIVRLRDSWNHFHDELESIKVVVDDFDTLFDEPIEPEKEGESEEEPEEPEELSEEEKKKMQRREKLYRYIEPFAFWATRSIHLWWVFWKAWKDPKEEEAKYPLRARWEWYLKRDELKRYHKQGMDALLETAKRQIAAYEELLGKAEDLTGEVMDITPNPLEGKDAASVLSMARLSLKHEYGLWIESDEGPQPEVLLDKLEEQFNDGAAFFVTTARMTRDQRVREFLWVCRSLQERVRGHCVYLRRMLDEYEREALASCRKSLAFLKKW